jgi:hypothetical protein
MEGTPLKIAQALALVMFFSFPAFAQAPDSATIAAHCVGDADEMAYRSVGDAWMALGTPAEAQTTELSEAEVLVVGSLQQKDENSTMDETVRTDYPLAADDQDLQSAISALKLLPEVFIPSDADQEGADGVVLNDRSDAEASVGTLQIHDDTVSGDGTLMADYSASLIESPTSPPTK